MRYRVVLGIGLAAAILAAPCVTEAKAISGGNSKTVSTVDPSEKDRVNHKPKVHRIAGETTALHVKPCGGGHGGGSVGGHMHASAADHFKTGGTGGHGGGGGGGGGCAH